MKKQTLLFMAGGLLAIASCNTNTGETGMTQATIDSTVNARVEEIRTEMMRQNDSLINAMATMKADSMIAEMNANKATGKLAAKPAPKAKPHAGTGTAVSTPVNTPTGNTGKNTGHEGSNAGKNTGNEGTNTGKKK